MTEDNQTDQTEAEKLKAEAWEANRAKDTVSARIVNAHRANDPAKELALRQQYEQIEIASQEIRQKRRQLETPDS